MSAAVCVQGLSDRVSSWGGYQHVCVCVVCVCVQASGMPVCVMAGVLAEMESLTLRVPGRCV